MNSACSCSTQHVLGGERPRRGNAPRSVGAYCARGPHLRAGVALCWRHRLDDAPLDVREAVVFHGLVVDADVGTPNKGARIANSDDELRGVTTRTTPQRQCVWLCQRWTCVLASRRARDQGHPAMAASAPARECGHAATRSRVRQANPRTSIVGWGQKPLLQTTQSSPRFYRMTG